MTHPQLLVYCNYKPIKPFEGAIISKATPSTLHARLQQAIYEIIHYAGLADQFNTQDHGVTVTQSYTLLHFPIEGFINMRDLSEKMHVANSTMTRMADQLLKRGLIRREHDENDRRVVQVCLTDEGRALRQQIEADYLRFFAMVLDELPPDDHETVVGSLETLVQAIMRVMDKKHGDKS